MPNIAQALKAEIARVSKKEIKTFVQPIKKSNILLKRTVTELKKKVAVLESENKRLRSKQKDILTPVISSEDAKKVRITSKGIKTLRSKLGLAREYFGKLLGVSSQAVYVMEHKKGSLKLRSSTLQNLLSVKKMGKREAKKRLEEL